jgi:heterodisulfide reductase subunit A
VQADTGFSRDNCSQFCLRRDIAHPNIELITGTRVDKVQGEAGNFNVSIVTESRRVRKDRCTACGKCVEVCPVEVPDEFERGLKNRKAIYVRNPQAVPNIYAIDPDACTMCGECVKVCPTGAIDLEMQEEPRQINVGAVIVSSGFDEFDAAQMGQYGFERYPNVLTNLQLERELASAGATGGRLCRPSDGEEPKKIAFLQCVGSRDMKRNYCSAACCMYALKESILIKEYNPDIDVTIFYMDMRAFGKDYYRDYLKAKDMGVKFIRCRVSTFREDPGTKNMLLVARAENGELISSEFGLVVLSVAQCPSAGTDELGECLDIELNQG